MIIIAIFGLELTTIIVKIVCYMRDPSSYIHVLLVESIPRNLKRMLFTGVLVKS